MLYDCECGHEYDYEFGHSNVGINMTANEVHEHPEFPGTPHFSNVPIFPDTSKFLAIYYLLFAIAILHLLYDMC